MLFNRTSFKNEWHQQPSINIPESKTVKGGELSGGASDGYKFGDAWAATPINPDERG